MNEAPAHLPERDDSQNYEIRLRHRLDPRWAARLGVPRLRHESDGTTILEGVAMDQAALHGLLQKVRDLGLTLVSVIRIDSEKTVPASADFSQPRNPK